MSEQGKEKEFQVESFQVLHGRARHKMQFFNGNKVVDTSKVTVTLREIETGEEPQPTTTGVYFVDDHTWIPFEDLNRALKKYQKGG